jgi:tetratricopeptide (TPR) repeat protein
LKGRLLLRAGSVKTDRDNARSLPATERVAQLIAGRVAPVAEWLVIVLAVLLAYANSLENGFVFEDVSLIREDSRIRGLSGLDDIFTTSYWDRPGTEVLYRPLTQLSLAVNYALGGYSPLGFHLANVALHALASVLAGLAAAVLFRRRMLGAVTGLLFALHPIHTECVAGIASGRSELLAAAGVFLALIAWGKAGEAAAGRRAGSWALVFALAFAFALFSHEAALWLVGVVLLETFVRRRERAMTGEAAVSWPAFVRPHLLCWGALALVAVAGVGVRSLVLGAESGQVGAALLGANPLLGAPTWQRVATAVRIQGDYLWLMACPLRLVADYSFDAEPLARSFLDTGVLLGALGLIGLAVAFLVLLRESPTAAFAIGFYLLAMAPASNLPYTVGAIKSEQFLYLPVFGFCLLGGLILERAWVRLRAVEGRIALGAALAILCVAYATRIHARGSDWRDDHALFSATVEDAPRNVRARNQLARALVLRGGLDAALGQIETAVLISPRDSESLISLGLCQRAFAERAKKGGRPSEAATLMADAEKAFRLAVQAAPGELEPAFVYAQFLCAEGRYDEGLSMLEAVHAMNPRDVRILEAAGRWNWWAAKESENRTERLEKAVDWMLRLWGRAPGHGFAARVLGISLYELERYEEALSWLERAAAIRQGARDDLLLLCLGGALYRLDRLDEAEQAFHQVLLWRPDSAQAALGMEFIQEARKTGQRKAMGLPPRAAKEMPSAPDDDGSRPD